MEKKEERWRELCAKAAVEQDPKKLIELVREITRLLDEKRNFAKCATNQPPDEPADQPEKP